MVPGRSASQAKAKAAAMMPTMKKRMRDHRIKALLQGRRGMRAPRFRACSAWRWLKPRPRIVEPAGEGVASGRRQRLDLLDGGGKIALARAPSRRAPEQRQARSAAASSSTRRMDTADFALAIMLSKKDVSAGACSGAGAALASAVLARLRASSATVGMPVSAWEGSTPRSPGSGIRDRSAASSAA